MTCYKELCIFE